MKDIENVARGYKAWVQALSQSKKKKKTAINQDTERIAAPSKTETSPTKAASTPKKNSSESNPTRLRAKEALATTKQDITKTLRGAWKRMYPLLFCFFETGVMVFLWTVANLLQGDP